MRLATLPAFASRPTRHLPTACSGNGQLSTGRRLCSQCQMGQPLADKVESAAKLPRQLLSEVFLEAQACHPQPQHRPTRHVADGGVAYAESAGRLPGLQFEHTPASSLCVPKKGSQRCRCNFNDTFVDFSRAVVLSVHRFADRRIFVKCSSSCNAT